MSILAPQIHGMPEAFAKHLGEYCSQMRTAIRANKHHDHRLNLLLTFLREAFSVEVEEIEIQRKVKAGSIRGRIDAFFRYIIFEMKCDLKRERDDGLIELKKYFESQREPDKYVGVISDGIDFEVYQHSASQISLVRSFKVEPQSPAIAFQELDELLATRPKQHATSQEICLRFGLGSVVLSRSISILTEAFESVRDNESVRTKFNEWDSLLAKVYGSRTQDRQMFLKHTYLALLSRCIVTEVLFPDAQRNTELYQGLIDGRFFRDRNIQNLAEVDFFAWGLGNAADTAHVDFIANLFRHLDDFRFDQLDQDLLKMLYQELVEPAERHGLGEYYTPDWLAQVTLEAIDYQRGRLLDPACGSGSFLYFAIHRLRQGGLTGDGLVSYALGNIIGIDVHPLAVGMAKANYLLALARDVRAHQRTLHLPVYLADTLLTEFNLSENTLHVPTGGRGEFRIPLATHGDPRHIDKIVDAMVEFAERGAHSAEAEKSAMEGFAARLKGLEGREVFYWRHSFRHMLRMVRSGRDTIWAFILKNAYQPVYLRTQKCRYIVGNPPWLAYRYIESEAYKQRVKDLTFSYGLLHRREDKLFTHMDTSTLFWVHCEHEFLEEGGTVAFVMPKSVIVPSQQHAAFQKRAFSAIHDFSAVSPLFKVPACLIIRGPNAGVRTGLPLTIWEGRFREKNPKPTELEHFLTSHTTTFSFISKEEPSSPYYDRFFQGATLVPRCLWFVEHPTNLPLDEKAPYLRTTPGARKTAKKPWALQMTGKVEKEFLFATVLGENLLPFGVRAFSLVVLPIRSAGSGSIHMMSSLDLLRKGAVHTHSWLQQAEDHWNKRKKATQPSIQEYLNWRNKLLEQNLRAQHVVLYATSGTNISAASADTQTMLRAQGLAVSGFVAESVTYYYYAASRQESDYLVGVLNSETVNLMIKPYQPHGLYGERHVHRRPFEVCPIPAYDSRSRLHRRIATISRKASEKLRGYLPKITGNAAQARATARQILGSEMALLNDLVRELFKNPCPKPRNKSKPKRSGPLDCLPLLF